MSYGVQLALFGTVETPLNKEVSQGCRAGVCAEEGCISTCCDIHCLLRDCHHDPAAVSCGQQVWRGEINWEPGRNSLLAVVLENPAGWTCLFSFSVQLPLGFVWKFQR